MDSKRSKFSYASSALACLLAVASRMLCMDGERKAYVHCTPSQQTCLAWEEICVLKWGDFAKSNQSVASWFILSAVSLSYIHVGAWNVERAEMNG